MAAEGTGNLIGYQNPTVTTDALLDATSVNPTDNQTGVPVVREKVEIVSLDGRRASDRVILAAMDTQAQSLSKRHYDRVGLQDRRGNFERGSTR